jgi:metal-responsive CopG/Arc/MetJ family transcriptional regulator
METIQVVIDTKLLEATDRAARRTKLNRSALVRAALREHLRNLKTRALEERDRRGYEARLHEGEESADWESEAERPLE